jgi:hypothetical protein
MARDDISSTRKKNWMGILRQASLSQLRNN